MSRRCNCDSNSRRRSINAPCIGAVWASSVLISFKLVRFWAVHEGPIRYAGEVKRIFRIKPSQYQFAAVTPYQGARKKADPMCFIYHFEHVSQWNTSMKFGTIPTILLGYLE